ncbi:extensin family protein [Mesorhizobium sp. SP-1A]|uniref:extensin-like domain-containing protein n=1 Tax=Mesorhizobium sp. SP-1A TaxID=3077840 RepID=UPI0028F6D317|nr:extensin family protein [Mesorhizobium sp. SP-1A]
MTAPGLRKIAALFVSVVALSLATAPSSARSHRHPGSHGHLRSYGQDWPRLPATAPLPELKEEAAPVAPEPPQQQPPASTEAPVPQPRPADAQEEQKPGTPPEQAPKPPEKPADAEKEAGPPEPKPVAPDPRSNEVPADKMPAGELACRDRLKALGVSFEEHGPEHDPGIGCSIPYPLIVKNLGASIALEPDAEMNCAMAEAAARFAGEVVSPAAKAELGSPVKTIGQASAYVCRPRHAGGKLSEHAFGNALDIARFTLEDGTAVDVKPSPSEKEKKFLDKVRNAACGPFKTVLGPGSDADHELHLHLDLQPRRDGGAFCD